ncbi:MAG: DNA/RNA nuclease SfsA [Alphaproteobacteria bacterium]|nr:DNA/RNA nuclease SfsA [Alphaproteobacteria bacterium]
MILEGLAPARLLRRYKRFLADVRLADGREVTVHCPNPGSMLGLADPGRLVWLRPSANPKAKLPYGWVLVEIDGGVVVGIEAILANRLVGETLAVRRISPLASYDAFRKEPKLVAGTRLDFALEGTGQPPCWLEVKSVTLSRRTGLAEFPDAVTARGKRHLDSLKKLRHEGHRAVLVFVAQRPDVERFSPAADIDPEYAAALGDAARSGVEVLAFSCLVSPTAIALDKPLPVDL